MHVQLAHNYRATGTIDYFDFMPRIGDTIMLNCDGQFTRVRVTDIVHCPLTQPLPDEMKCHTKIIYQWLKPRRTN